MSAAQPEPPAAPPVAELRHAATIETLAACFPVIAELRPQLKDVDEWCDRATAMQVAGYRVLAAWSGDRALALAGYRVIENLIHGRFLYVDDLVSTAEHRGQGLGARLLHELSVIGSREGCGRLVLDTAAANAGARRFYLREGLYDLAVGFIKPLEPMT
ncbi:GNAT family N-acetyltransferase [Sphingomonas sp.]|uniref:GNAT family N-acetyltransferase n=1 Tax=Sphingomonas sp. TaxID=28214 RepID=UPI003D6D8EF0